MFSFSNTPDDPVLPPDGRQSAVAADVQRGVSRLLVEMGYSPLTELTLKTGRRVDIAALNDKGEIIVVEIKSSVADFRSDQKWQDYLDFCDQFYFAVPVDFPSGILPQSAGLIIADQYGGEISQIAVHEPVSAARRKMILLLFARAAANRIHRIFDPYQ
ncbi:MAG: MmcB family DNA repair protein [Fimbriimonadaceae bacterium]|nr:MmcB family DNA repair protein [Alphaproteobacteria bacterium]